MSCCEISNEFYAFHVTVLKICSVGLKVSVLSSDFFFHFVKMDKIVDFHVDREKKVNTQRFTSETIRYAQTTDKAHQPTFFFRYEIHFYISNICSLLFQLVFSFFILFSYLFFFLFFSYVNLRS